MAGSAMAYGGDKKSEKKNTYAEKVYCERLITEGP